MRRVASNIADGTLADGKRLPTIAWGVAEALDRPITVDALVDAADRAMYRHRQAVDERFARQRPEPG